MICEMNEKTYNVSEHAVTMEDTQRDQTNVTLEWIGNPLLLQTGVDSIK